MVTPGRMYLGGEGNWHVRWDREGRISGTNIGKGSMLIVRFEMVSQPCESVSLIAGGNGNSFGPQIIWLALLPFQGILFACSNIKRRGEYHFECAG